MPTRSYIHSNDIKLYFKYLDQFQKKDAPTQACYQDYQELLEHGLRFQEFLKDSRIKRLDSYAELTGIFQWLCERSREIHESCPPELKPTWLCFSVSTIILPLFPSLKPISLAYLPLCKYPKIPRPTIPNR